LPDHHKSALLWPGAAFFVVGISMPSRQTNGQDASAQSVGADLEPSAVGLDRLFDASPSTRTVADLGECGVEGFHRGKGLLSG
jgi:hypothetical protein